MHVVIIGNGITGITAAKTVRGLQPEWKITLVSGESTYHYSRPALMYVFMGHMRYRDTKPYEDHFWAQERIDLLRAWVTRIDTAKKQLELHGGTSLTYDKLLIATGSKSNRFGWPGQDLGGVQSLYSLMDLKLLHENVENTRHAVLVGGGLIGIELAEMLHSRNIPITFLVRESDYWDNVLPSQEARMLNRVLREEGIDLRLKTELKEIVDDGTGRVCAVLTNHGERIECQLVGLTAGVSPNTVVVDGSGIETGRGILVDWSLRASAPDVFAAGDCAELVTPEGERNTIQQVWYTGKMQGEVVGAVMAGEDRRYDPGIWYNSAKFFDLEYQTYGEVRNRPGPDECHLWWEHKDHRHALRLVVKDNKVVGFNIMGMRYRHRVCERWIREERSPAYVLEHLAEATFDPEFYRSHEREIRSALQEEQLV